MQSPPSKTWSLISFQSIANLSYPPLIPTIDVFLVIFIITMTREGDVSEAAVDVAQRDAKLCRNLYLVTDGLQALANQLFVGEGGRSTLPCRRMSRLRRKLGASTVSYPPCCARRHIRGSYPCSPVQWLILGGLVLIFAVASFQTDLLLHFTDGLARLPGVPYDFAHNSVGMGG